MDSNLDAVSEAVDGLTEESIALAVAVQLTNVEYEEEAPPGDTLPEQEQTILDVVGILQDHGLDLTSEETLRRLGLTVDQFEGPSEDVEVSTNEDVAQERFEDYIDAPEEEFELLADIGTNPNVTYLGKQPGPNAHQVPGPTSYEEVDMLNVRQKALDDETVSIVDRDVDLGVGEESNSSH